MSRHNVHIFCKCHLFILCFENFTNICFSFSCGWLGEISLVGKWTSLLSWVSTWYVKVLYSFYPLFWCGRGSKGNRLGTGRYLVRGVVSCEKLKATSLLGYKEIILLSRSFYFPLSFLLFFEILAPQDPFSSCNVSNQNMSIKPKKKTKECPVLSSRTTMCVDICSLLRAFFFFFLIIKLICLVTNLL